MRSAPEMIAELDDFRLGLRRMRSNLAAIMPLDQHPSVRVVHDMMCDCEAAMAQAREALAVMIDNPPPAP